MGLDAYFYTTPTSCIPEGKVTDFKFEDFMYNYRYEHIYLRKEWGVHNFMFELYKEKGGEKNSGEFNCVPLVLTLKDIERIERAIKSQEIVLEWMDGNRRIQEGFAEIKKQIKTGKIVPFYDSWW